MKMDARQSAQAVERFACPTCGAPAGSVCRTRSGMVAVGYHTPRFVLVPELGQAGDVPVPPDRNPLARWVPREPVAVRIGYCCTVAAGDDAEDRLAGLVAAGCAAIFLDIVGPTVRVRPELARALRLSADQRGCAEDQPVVFTVWELAQLARTGAELIETAGALRAADVSLDIRSGPLTGVYHPHGMGSLLFDVLVAMADLDRADRRQRIRAGQQAAADQGNRGGRPPVFDHAMLAEARRLYDQGVPVPGIADQLLIATGKNAGRHPSLASVYRALAAEPAAPHDTEPPADEPHSATSITVNTSRGRT